MKTTITPSAVPSSRGIAATFTFILTLSVLLAPRVANAQVTATFPYQSFVDNFVSPNGALDYTWAPGYVELAMEKGAMALLKPAMPIFPGAGGYVHVGLSQVRQHEEGIVAADTSMQVVIRLSNETTRLGLWARAGSDGNAYVCNLRPDGRLTLGRFVGGTVAEVQTTLDPVDSDVVVEFDTIGDTITARAWALRRPNVVYSTSFKDEHPRDQGTLGLGVVYYNLNPANPPTFKINPDASFEDSAVIFYQFKLKIIPPTSNRR